MESVRSSSVYHEVGKQKVKCKMETKENWKKFCPFNGGMKIFLKSTAQDFWEDDLLLPSGDFSEMESHEILIGCIIF